MENKKFSLKQVFNKSLSLLNGNWLKAMLSSLMQFGVFLIVFLLTNSLMISLISWAIFLPTQTAFMINIADENVHLENVFNLGRQWLTYVLLAIVGVISYLCGFVLAIIPAIVLFINFAFVFELAFQDKIDVLSAFKKSHQISKGYRPKILAVGLIYLFILLILVAFCILIAMLVGLCLNTNSYLLYVWGTFAGLSLYLLLVVPVQVLTVSNLKNEILKDKELSYVKPEEPNIDANKDVEDNEKVIEQPEKEEVDQTDPTDLIV